ncbi:hypothetical protein DL546_003176 [Coniochaeta pulveracea]|uniref:Uncharacterized protein n=1 Tax=Coniochaeta pulveracea TaxID=177199 RepID=A0A420YBX0_9PEZI|nr:hypothetical protein DL546_003176 [Coniochaeta pulveracea]
MSGWYVTYVNVRSSKRLVKSGTCHSSISAVGAILGEFGTQGKHQRSSKPRPTNRGYYAGSSYQLPTRVWQNRVRKPGQPPFNIHQMPSKSRCQAISRGNTQDRADDR